MISETTHGKGLLLRSKGQGAPEGAPGDSARGGQHELFLRCPGHQHAGLADTIVDDADALGDGHGAVPARIEHGDLAERQRIGEAYPHGAAATTRS